EEGLVHRDAERLLSHRAAKAARPMRLLVERENRARIGRAPHDDAEARRGPWEDALSIRGEKCPRRKVGADTNDAFAPRAALRRRERVPRGRHRERLQTPDHDGEPPRRISRV